LTVYERHSPGDEGCIRDYVHVSDVVRPNVSAIEGEIRDIVLNVGTGVGTSTRQLAQQLMQLSGLESELLFAGKRDGDVEYSVLKVTRFQEFFGSALSLTDGLRKSILSH